MKDESKSFEEALEELESIVDKLEKGELTLDKSLEYFQRGVELSKYCNKRLDEVEKKMSVLVEAEDGSIKEEPV